MVFTTTYKQTREYDYAIRCIILAFGCIVDISPSGSSVTFYVFNIEDREVILENLESLGGRLIKIEEV